MTRFASCVPSVLLDHEDDLDEQRDGERPNRKALEVGGRVIVIGVGAGAWVEFDLWTLMARRARISASTLRRRPLEEKAATARALERHVMPLFAQGELPVTNRRRALHSRTHSWLTSDLTPGESSARWC
jgi:hypothetical protein